MGRILVAYATRYGSTMGITEAIGKAICEAGIDADVRPAREVRDVSGYDGVIAGGPILCGLWHGDVKRFVKRDQRALAGIPTAYFAVGIGFKDLTDEVREVGLKAMRSTADMIEPVEYGFFAGSATQLPSLIAKAMSANCTHGDMRDWEAIAAWAKDLAPKLVA